MIQDQNTPNAAGGAGGEGAPEGAPQGQPQAQAQGAAQPQGAPAPKPLQYPPPIAEPARGPFFSAPHPPVAPPPAPRKESKGYLVGIAIVVAVCLAVITSIVSCTSIVNSSMGALSLSGGSDEAPEDGRAKVGVIELAGTIQYDGTASSPEGLRTLLDQAEQRSDIKAVVLRVNSGGGVATAGEEMAHYVKEFGKPIVVSSAATNASAAYEISSQADYIITSKTTAIGAIGVAMQVTDLSGLYDKLGISIESITSADSKDSSYGNRPLTEEERAWYQRLVDQIDADFVEAVADGRGMDVEEVRALATGMTFTGFDAVENGLADALGYFEDAVAEASKEAGYTETLPAARLTLSQDSNLRALLDIIGEAKSPDDAALAERIERDLGVE